MIEKVSFLLLLIAYANSEDISKCKAWEILINRKFERSCAIDAYQRTADQPLCTCKSGYVRKTPHESLGPWECIKLNKCVCSSKEKIIEIGSIFLGCKCKNGYRRSYENDCVPKSLCNGPNEIYSTCNNCPPRIICTKPCTAGCKCKDGYAYSSNGICLPTP